MKRSFVALLLLYGATPAQAATWDLVQGEAACGIAKQLEDDGRTNLMFIEKVEGGFAADISNDNWTSIVPKQKYPLVLAFDKKYFTVNAVGYADEGGKGFRFSGESDLAASFASAKSLVIMRDTDPVTTVLAADLTGGRAGIAQVGLCVAYMRSERDAELAEAQALERKRQVIPADPFFDPSAATPTSNPGRWVKTSDYPASAMTENREGVTAFRLTVDADGGVSSCEITTSSGHADLDEAACTIVRREARFNPARSGAASRYYSNRITWRAHDKTS